MEELEEFFSGAVMDLALGKFSAQHDQELFDDMIQSSRGFAQEVSDDVEYTDISSTSLEDIEKITQECIQDISEEDDEEDLADSVPSSSTNECLERKQPKLTANKICLVCGDAALGKNFGAVSCESCKAFFRRNALKDVFGRCEGKCDVSVENRSYCKRCRMTKCLAIGMKREMLITQQRKRRKPTKENCGTSGSALIRLQKGVLNLDSLTPRVPSLGDSKQKDCQGSGGGGSPTRKGRGSPERISTASNLFDATGKFTNWETTRTYGLASGIPDSVMDHVPEEIREDINEIINAFEVSFDQCNVNPRRLPEEPDAFEIHALMGISIKKLVKMGKHLKKFQTLKQEDQIMLLKAAVVEILVLRSVTNYNPETGTWFAPKSQSNSESYNFVKAKGLNQGYDVETQDMFTKYTKFVESMQQLLKGDSIIVMLLIVITLFSGDQTILKEKNKVDKCQEHFSRVLEIYCRHLYPTRPEVFPKSLVFLMDLRSIHEIQSQMLAKMPVDKLEPLIKEIFDV